QVSSDHERYPADVKCLGFLYLYVGRYPRNNASRNSCNALLFSQLARLGQNLLSGDWLDLP
ncbi:MAG: hypothetical protein BECKG1743E_GA0114224_111703, partial [Candidatus Kentron sp. G]